MLSLHRTGAVEQRVGIVAIIAIPPPVTGQALASKALIKALERHRVDAGYVNLSHGLKRRFGALGAIVRCLHLALLSFQALRLLLKQKKGERKLYLQIGFSNRTLFRDALFLSVARMVGAKTIVHLHGCGLRSAIGAAPAPLRRIVRALLRKVDLALVLSKRLRSEFESDVSANRVRVLQNFIPDEIRAARFAAKEGLREGRLRVLFLSNLLPGKGYRIVLEAARLAEQEGRNLEFTLAGVQADPQCRDVGALVAEMGLRYTRYVGEAAGARKIGLLRDSDVMVLPSESEGVPLVILEAFAAGIPVVATGVGGIPDIVEDGRNGFLIPPRDPKALYSALLRFVDRPGLLSWMSTQAAASARAVDLEDSHGAKLVRLILDS